MQVIFLFLESLGTPEMVLIALIALIVFGPRKLPQIGRTIGKYTAEFKRASREFRDTFEREVQMAELEEKQATTAGSQVAEREEDNFKAVENTIGRSRARQTVSHEEDIIKTKSETDSIALPEIRAVSQADFPAQSNSNLIATPEMSAETTEITAAPPPSRKREWL